VGSREKILGVSQRLELTDVAMIKHQVPWARLKQRQLDPDNQSCEQRMMARRTSLEPYSDAWYALMNIHEG